MGGSEEVAGNLLIDDFADKKIPHPLRGIRDDKKRKAGFGMTAEEKQDSE